MQERPTARGHGKLDLPNAAGGSAEPRGTGKQVSESRWRKSVGLRWEDREPVQHGKPTCETVPSGVDEQNSE